MLSRRSWILLVCGLVSAILLVEIFREFHPLAGNWEVARKFIDGQEIELDHNDIREAIEIDGSYARVIWYTPCGNDSNHIFAEGFIVQTGNQLNLFKRVRNTSELETTPSGQITLMENGRLSYDHSDSEGTVVVEFRRESNSSTLMDLLGWR